VHFPSLEDNGAGQPPTTVDGYLFRPAGTGPFPAIVGLHGCSGMFVRGTSMISPIYREWAAELTRHGFVFLLVDSLRPRQHGQMCSVDGFDFGIYRRRPRDAYGALRYLQAQPFVRRDASALPAGRRAAPPRCTPSGDKARIARAIRCRSTSARRSPCIPEPATSSDREPAGAPPHRYWC
jgi:hypothetical protein